MVAAMEKKTFLTETNIQSAFKLIDKLDRGYISIEELQQILSLGGKAISEIKDQIDDVKSLEKKILKSSKEGWVYLIKIFFNVFIASSVVAIAIYYLIKFLNS